MISYQVAQMTSSQVIIHLFLPHIKWEWHHSPPPKQVLSWLLPPFGHKHFDRMSSWNEQYNIFNSNRFKFQHGEGLDYSRRYWGDCEDGEQGKVLHWISFLVPWRYGFISVSDFFVKHYAPESFIFSISLCRDATFKWEWLTELWRSWVSQTRLVLQTTTKGQTFRLLGDG